MTDTAALKLNSDCHCWPNNREDIIKTIVKQQAFPTMESMLSERENYFANTITFLATDIINQMKDQIHAIEDTVKQPKYMEAVRNRPNKIDIEQSHQTRTSGVFMGYDFHITEDGPRLIEINSNAGGAFIVNMIETVIHGDSIDFAKTISEMFISEWVKAGRITSLKTIAIIDTNPTEQYHFPDMCLAKTLLQKYGYDVMTTDPSELWVGKDGLYIKDKKIDLIYNRLTDFDLSDPEHAILRQAYLDNTAVITPAPHHHALYADKRNLILLTDEQTLAEFDVTQAHIKSLRTIPTTHAVTAESSESMWSNRKKLFFKPEAGFGSRGAFRGAKLTKKVWGQILEGGYIAQDMIKPPVRAVTVNANKEELKFDVRVYTYDGEPLLYASRIYQGQTTNLRTAGGGLAAVIPTKYYLSG